MTVDALQHRWFHLYERTRGMSCIHRRSEVESLSEGLYMAKAGVRQQCHGQDFAKLKRYVRGLEHMLVMDPRPLPVVSPCRSTAFMLIIPSVRITPTLNLRCSSTSLAVSCFHSIGCTVWSHFQGFMPIRLFVKYTRSPKVRLMGLNTLGMPS